MPLTHNPWRTFRRGFFGPWVPLFAILVNPVLANAPTTKPQNSVSPSIAARPPSTVPAPSPEQIQALLNATQGQAIGPRLKKISRIFRGQPYGFSPLGEGPKAQTDTDPRLRFDLFDCTTFVETSVALSLSANLDEAQRTLDQIRYQDGQVSFLTRKHFPGAQWIPQNIRQGFFVDVTRQVGGAATQIASKDLSAKDWARRKKDILPDFPDDKVPFGTHSLPYIPLAQAPLLLAKIPDATVVNFVRADFGNIPVRVAHQGLLFWRGDKLILRHAIAKKANRVFDEDFAAYLHRATFYKRWPMSGINLLQVQDPHPKMQKK